MKTLLSLGILFGAALLPLQLSAENRLQETRSVLDKWIETKQIVSKEKSDWRVEEVIITDTKAVLTHELDRLHQILEDFASSATGADEERERLHVQRDRLLEGTGAVESTMADLEARIKTIVAGLPAPLVEIIKPLIRRLPEDPENTKSSVGERMQNIVGILSQADKFNNTLVRTSESREIRPGKIVEVRTLYWGLAMAYYVDTSGEFAGIGTPAAEGWEWTPVEGIGGSIRTLLDVYEGVADIQFVSVPARIN